MNERIALGATAVTPGEVLAEEFLGPMGLRACLKTRFGVPPLGGAAQKPPKGGTPNLPQRVSMVFFKQALSQRELARRMGVRPMRVNEIVRGKRTITAAAALRLAEALGTSARFWMNLQSNHDLALAALAYRKAA